ncbi:hypothetical protein BDA99DRAFT_575178 [Phascolomyces articulosus]|uniref:F-box domain-containing protein n=1 Tax=Phascolomyces articulosus TaxID=60185 RepID=A0AAD5JRT4_9FUNG|nr:hypothetical protein BDA99DRAFT_575178 [Phascolomyces articulosus]
MLLYLPNELLLHILTYINKENHLDLVSIASTCLRLNKLVTDRTIWSGPVNVILDRWSQDTTKQLALMLAREQQQSGTDSNDNDDKAIMVKKDPSYRTTHITVAIEQAESSWPIYLLKNIFEMQQRKQQHLTDIHIYIPAIMHMSLIENALLCYDGSIQSLILRDTTTTTTTDTITSDVNEEEEDMNNNNNNDRRNNYYTPSIEPCVRQWISKSKHTLKNIELPSFPLHWLPTHDLAQLESLTILAAASLDAHQLRQDLPSLKHLTLHLEQADHFSFVRPLLTNKLLYPWIESLTVICQDDLKLSLDQNELTECLMTIKGLSRVNAGWDMVVVDTL